MPFVIVRKHFKMLDEPEMEIRPITERPLQKLSQKQIDALPEQFRCYSCQQKFKKRDIGGIELGQRLCKLCYPWLDEWLVGSLIKFDLKHHFPVEGYSQSKSKVKWHQENKGFTDVMFRKPKKE